jgi:hypothetical protein
MGDIFVDVLFVEEGGIYNSSCSMNERAEKYASEASVINSETNSSDTIDSELPYILKPNSCGASNTALCQIWYV